MQHIISESSSAIIKEKTQVKKHEKKHEKKKTREKKRIRKNQHTDWRKENSEEGGRPQISGDTKWRGKAERSKLTQVDTWQGSAMRPRLAISRRRCGISAPVTTKAGEMVIDERSMLWRQTVSRPCDSDGRRQLLTPFHFRIRFILFGSIEINSPFFLCLPAGELTSSPSRPRDYFELQRSLHIKFGTI